MEKSATTVKELLSRIDQLLEEGARIQHKIAHDIEQVCKKIVSGESTGDRILDLVLVKYHQRYEPAIQFYRYMEKRIAEKQGELFLAVEKWEDSNGGDFGPSHNPRDFHKLLQIYFFMGVITGTQLKISFNPTVCEFPLGSQVRFTAERDTLTKLDLPLTRGLRYNPVEDTGQRLKCENPLNQLDDHVKLEFFIGDAAVEDYFDRCKLSSLKERFGNIKKMLGK